MKIHPLLPFLCLLGSSVSADVTLFHGPAGGPGNIAVHDDLGVNPATFPASLQGITLLPLDFVGRTQLDELALDRPRLRTDIPGAARLALPGNMGSLYHYRRDLNPSGAVFGWMLIGADGVAQSLWEAPGTGLNGDIAPVIPRVAVTPAGDAFLFATTLTAGGDLIELDLASGSATLRSSQIAPQAFSLAGLFLRENWGIAATTTGVYRFDRLPGAEAQPVTFPNAPVWYSGEVTVSGDGNVAAIAAGANSTTAHLYSFASTGDAFQITTTTATFTSAGYLPEHLDGPYLALDQTGSACGWLTDGVSREAFLAEGINPILPASNQLTGNSTYLDTLDEIGVLFFVPGALIYAVGEAGPTPGAAIENIDVYRATMGATATPQLTNLSLSSGVMNPPFFSKSSIQPDALYRLPGSNDLLILNRENNTGKLLLVQTGSSAPIELLNESKSIDLIEEAAGHLLVSVRRTTPIKTRDLLRFDLAQPKVLTSLASLDVAFSYLRPAPRADGWVAFIVTDNPGVSEYLARVHLPTLKGKLLLRIPLVYGPEMSWTQAGNLMFSVDSPTIGSTFFGWPIAPFLLPLLDGPPQGFVLPGN